MHYTVSSVWAHRKTTFPRFLCKFSWGRMTEFCSARARHSDINHFQVQVFKSDLQTLSSPAKMTLADTLQDRRGPLNTAGLRMIEINLYCVKPLRFGVCYCSCSNTTEHPHPLRIPCTLQVILHIAARDRSGDWKSYTQNDKATKVKEPGFLVTLWNCQTCPVHLAPRFHLRVEPNPICLSCCDWVSITSSQTQFLTDKNLKKDHKYKCCNCCGG